MTPLDLKAPFDRLAIALPFVVGAVLTGFLMTALVIFIALREAARQSADTIKIGVATACVRCHIFRVYFSLIAYGIGFICFVSARQHAARGA